jgi:hypothetical protein
MDSRMDETTKFRTAWRAARRQTMKSGVGFLLTTCWWCDRWMPVAGQHGRTYQAASSPYQAFFATTRMHSPAPNIIVDLFRYERTPSRLGDDGVASMECEAPTKLQLCLHISNNKRRCVVVAVSMKQLDGTAASLRYMSTSIFAIIGAKGTSVF